MKLIINADDYGMDASKTQSIADCFERGLITQTTMIVNSEYAYNAAAKAKECGFADRIGLHLNLTEGMPITESIREDSFFCDDCGSFNCEILRNFSSEVQLLKSQTEFLIGEISAQIERYLDLGMTLRHCDGHNHVEMTECVAPVLMQLLEKYRFRTIRRMNYIPLHDWKPHIRTRLHVFKYNRLAKIHKLRVADGFANWPEFQRYIKRTNSNDCIEFMTHPRYIDNELIDVVDFDQNRGPTMNEVSQFIHELEDVEFMSYLDL